MSFAQALSVILDRFREALDEARSDAFYTQTTNYVAFMGYTILIWDHVTSFSDEVRYVWTRPKSPATYLFFLNRYFTTIAFLGNLVAYFSDWSIERFVRYEGSCTIIALEVAALMMLLRVWALYKGQNKIIGSVIFLLVVETAIHAWLMTSSQAVDHPYPPRPCTMIFNPGLRGWPSLSAWAPLIYDTYVTVLTLYKCMPRVRKSSPSYIFHVLLRDGLLYYSVIFVINFILAIMILAAPDPIKNITAQLEQMLTVAMISHITLSLRRSADLYSQGLVTTGDNAYRFELDGWRATKDELRSVHAHQRSTTMCRHISVVSGSGFSSAFTSSPLNSQTRSIHDGKDAHIDHHCDGSRRHSVDLGTNSIGVLSISPAHSSEAAAAMNVHPVDRVAIVRDPPMLNDRSTYELRVMRPTHTANLGLRTSND